MKVKELIEILQTCNADYEIKFGELNINEVGENAKEEYVALYSYE